MALVVQAGFLQYPHRSFTDMGNCVRYFDACRVQRFNLVVSSSLAAADDGARMAHAFLWARWT